MIKRLLTTFIILSCLSLIFSQVRAQILNQEAAANQHLFIPLLWKTVPHDWIGPEGGLITALVIDAQNSSNVFAGSWDGGVYQSTNGGATWKRASQGLDNLKVV
ncbi:MAG TPA: hypothetical protein VJ436_08645 [Anaerolineales bacterium]|nr:hypothetical protein [Anaerolineales bacterium]